MKIPNNTVRMLAEISSYATMFSESKIVFDGSCFMMSFRTDGGVLIFDDVVPQLSESPIMPLIVRTLRLWCKPSAPVNVDYKTFKDFADFVFKNRITIKRFHFEGVAFAAVEYVCEGNEYVYESKMKTVTQRTIVGCFKVMRKDVTHGDE